MAACTDQIVEMVTFARVVKAQSFTAAAKKLGVSKSVVSARVARLEDRLGVRLLHRTTRQLSVTDDGLTYYQRCARLVAEADEAEHLVDGAAVAPRGLLRVNAPVDFGAHLAAPVAEMLRLHTELRIDLSLTDRFIDPIAEAIDVVVRVSGRLADSGMQARRLASDQRVVCGSPAYLARRGVPLSPRDLAHHNCLGYTLVRRDTEWRFRAAADGPTVGNLASDSGAFLRQSALAGIGLAALPGFVVAEDLAAGRLRRVLADHDDVKLGIYALHTHGKTVPAKVRVFIDLLAQRWRSPPWVI